MTKLKAIWLALKHYLFGVFICLDYLANALFLRSNPWETMSSVAFRKHRDKKKFGFMMYIINGLAFSRTHCADAYKADRDRQLPI